MILDELLPEVLLGAACIGGGVGHNEAGAALGVERGIEELYPEIVSVVGARQAERKAAARSNGVLDPFLVDGVDVEGRVGEDKIEVASGVVWVVVVAVDVAAVADVTF